MKTRPTPEIDAFAIKFKTPCGEKYWVPVDIARKLERERDEARGQRDSLAESLRECREDRGKCNMCSPCEQQYKYEN